MTDRFILSLSVLSAQLVQRQAYPIGFIAAGLFYMPDKAFAHVVQPGSRNIGSYLAFLQYDGAGDKVLYLLDKMGRKEYGLIGLKYTGKDLVKILAVKYIVPGKGHVHQYKIGSL